MALRRFFARAEGRKGKARQANRQTVRVAICSRGVPSGVVDVVVVVMPDVVTISAILCPRFAKDGLCKNLASYAIAATF